MIKRVIFPAALTMSIVLFACASGDDTGGTYVRAINEPWEDVLVPEQSFAFMAESGDTIALDNGTIIRIPGGILVNSKGEKVTGEVELTYTEMYTPASIIASGIPMDYDSGGTNFQFQSAGMFDMNANQNGDPLAIETGKSIEMDFATTRRDMTYSFYHYDTVAHAWDFQDIPEVDTNEARAIAEEELAAAESTAPLKPAEYNGKDPVIELDFDLSKHPELAGYEGIIWQYAGQGLNPENNKWIYNTDWVSADLNLTNREQGTYALSLKNAEKSFTTFIRPVLKGQDYEKALADFTSRTEKFEAEESARRAEAERIAAIPPYVSRLYVLVFGVSNLDCIRHDPDFIFANVKFNLKDFAGSRSNVTVYVISGAQQTTIAYSAASSTAFYYKPGLVNKAIAVDHTTGKSFTLNPTQFGIQSGSSDNVALTLEPNETPVTDMASLEKLINEL